MVAVKSNHINGENEIAFSGINQRSHVRTVLEQTEQNCVITKNVFFSHLYGVAGSYTLGVHLRSKIDQAGYR